MSREALELNEILRNAPKAVDMDLPHQREAGEHAEDMTSEPEGVAYEEAYAVDGLWATPQSWNGESAIMYLYGGGYVISSPHARRKLAGHLANASGARALVPRYHLAPERPFPSAVEDAANDFRWLLKEGYRPERVIIAGDSSAGGLTVATILKLREDGTRLPAGGVPISPWVDLVCTGQTLETNAAADLTATKASLQRMAGQYLNGVPTVLTGPPATTKLSSMSVEFLLTSLVVVLIPGTGVIYTLSSSIGGGWRRGLFAAIGCTFGIVPHMLAAMLGLSAIMQAGSVVFETVRWVGVAYLVFMGVSMIREGGTLQLDGQDDQHGSIRSMGLVVWRGILLNLLNPKLTIFFFAFLPQILQTPPGLLDLRLIWLGGVFMLMTLAVFVVYAYASATVRELVLGAPVVLRWFQRSLGALLIGLAARLALTDR